MLHALICEDAPASGLRAEPVERRIAAVDRELQRLGEANLVRGHAEGDDHRDLGLADQPPDPLERTGTSEELSRQGLVTTVDERHRFEALPRLGRVELGDEREVVVEDARMNRLRGHVDHARLRSAQEAEDEAEEPLLVRR